MEGRLTLAEHDVDDRAAAPSRLVLELVADLSDAPSGMAFIASSLDRLAQERGLTSAHMVVDDPTLGIQLFRAGRRPFDARQGEPPSAILALGPGLHVAPDELDELERTAIAQLCCVALRLDRLQYESLHDPLTDLLNRRGFEEHLAGAISRSVRHGWPCALVLLDLDGFKAINDRLGHQGGDLVLRNVAGRLRRGLRAGDVAARVGGDEFALLLHLEDGHSTASVLERLAATSEEAVGDEVTWAAGAAMCPDEGSSVGDLYRLADRRLYEAKASEEHRSA